MRTLPVTLVQVALVFALHTAPTAAADTAAASVNVSVLVAPRTSLRVSSHVLQFNALAPGVATASIDFSAAARVPAGADVVLTVERLSDVKGSAAAPDGEPTITFAGESAGVIPGTIRCETPAAAGRWHGSGRREGRLVFTMQATAAGHYSVPVRFVLSTP
jgi:hypothetical protein